MKMIRKNVINIWKEYMLNSILIILVLLLSKASYSAEYKFTCFNAINYGYINGIKNKAKKDANVSSSKIADSFNLKKVTTIYNETHLFGVKDLVDSFYQKIEEASLFGSLRAKLWLLTNPFNNDNRI